MSSWKSIGGKPNDHVCPYLKYRGGHTGSGVLYEVTGIGGYDWEEWTCDACKKEIAKQKTVNLCYDSNNETDIFETCEAYKKTRNPF